MPKASRQRIEQRGQVDLNSRTGQPRVVSTVNASAKGGGGGGIHISDNSRFAGAGWRNLSSVLANMADDAEAEERKAEIESKIAQQEAKAASKEAEREAKALTERTDFTSGRLAGLTVAREINEKIEKEGWGLEEASEYYDSALASVNASTAYIKGFDTIAWKSVEKAANAGLTRQSEEIQDTLNASLRQGFEDLHGNYDPDVYHIARQELYDSRDMHGIRGSQINEFELQSIENNAQRFASTDPLKAQQLLALAEQKRPDGTDSLAASIPGGYTRLQKLREVVNNTIIKDNALTDAELKREIAETTKKNSLDALSTIAQMGDPEAVRQWAEENIKGKSLEELETLYGDYRSDVLGKVKSAQSNIRPEGNEQALAEWSMKINRGQAEWEDIRDDKRLNDPQRAQLYSNLNTITQQAAKGYLTDAQLAVKLVNDLEQSWPNSVYGSPWTGSRTLEPGKPPVVTPEGSFYQGELLKRLREADPVLDVNKSNEQKLSIAQEVHDEIITGRLKFNAYDGKVNEPIPELKLSQKIKEGVTLSDHDVTALGKAYNNGGPARIRDAYGVDLFALNEMEQRRVAGEAQRQKAELEALKSQSFWGDIPNTDDFEMQRLEESRRLTVEAMELNRLLWSGEDIKIDG